MLSFNILSTAEFGLGILKLTMFKRATGFAKNKINSKYRLQNSCYRSKLKYNNNLNQQIINLAITLKGIHQDLTLFPGISKFKYLP